MTRLEERYRRVLRVLPVSYRDAWEEDMVATFLASVHTDEREDADYIADFGRPGWTEVLSVAVLAVKLRLGTAGAPPRYAAWGEAVRLCVLIGVLVNAGGSLIGVSVSLWLNGIVPLPRPELFGPLTAPDPLHRAYLFATLSGVLWLPAFLTLLSGRAASARWLALAAFCADTFAACLAVFVDRHPISGELAYNFILNALLVSGLMVSHCGMAKPPRPRAWLAGLGVCVALIAGHGWLTFRPATTTPLAPLDPTAVMSIVVVSVAAVHLIRQARHRFERFSAWTPALAVIALSVAGLRLVTLLDFVRYGALGWHPATMTFGAIEAVAVAAAATALVLMSARALRRLPSGPNNAGFNHAVDSDAAA